MPLVKNTNRLQRLNYITLYIGIKITDTDKWNDIITEKTKIELCGDNHTLNKSSYGELSLYLVVLQEEKKWTWLNASELWNNKGAVVMFRKVFE